MTLPDIKRHIKKCTLHDENLEALKSLGFYIDENGSRLVLTITGDKQLMLSRLKLIVSKMVFEIFQYKDFENESFIHFTEKGGR